MRRNQNECGERAIQGDNDSDPLWGTVAAFGMGNNTLRSNNAPKDREDDGTNSACIGSENKDAGNISEVY